MSDVDNATGREPVTASAGLVLGFAGVLAFSFSFPATRLAVEDLDPWFVAFGRAAVAGVLAAAYLALTHAPRPSARQWRRLTIVGGGVVVGFPLLTSIALQTSDSAHGAVVIAILPAATALAAVARAGERPGPLFWGAALGGLAITVAFTLAQSGGTITAADALLLAATAVCALGYAEGGALSRELGGARTICWGLVLSAPVTIPVTATAGALGGLHDVAPTAWLGFAYVALFSMFLGFFAWYAGLARGGVARVGQIQLTQPLLTLVWSALVLGEHVGAGMVLAAGGVLACVVVTQRARVRQDASPCPQAPRPSASATPPRPMPSGARR